MKIIYISGPIQSIDRLDARNRFQNAENMLRDKDWNVINPIKIAKPENATWADCMVADIAKVFDADAIYMLRQWKQSTGARIELDVAIEIGLEIHFEENIKFETHKIAEIPAAEKLHWK